MQAEAGSPAFPAFATLPLELRDQVWRDALPDEPGRPTLFPYVEGSWVRGSFQPGDEWYTQLDGGSNNTSRYNTPAAADIAVDTPLLHVNRESRRIALAWAHKRGYTVERQQGGGGGGPSQTTTTTTTTTINVSPADYDVDAPGGVAVTRPVDPSLDAIYLPTAEIADRFVKASWSLWSVTDAADDNHGGGGGFQFDSSLTAVALPEALLRGESNGLFYELDLSQPRWRLLYIVLDPQPDVESGSWELIDDTVYGPGSFTWDDERRAFTRPESAPARADDALYKSIRRLVEMLGDADEDFRSDVRAAGGFEIRVAHAVKRR